jgi:phosphatidylinositol alpha-mannosyltransferase
MPDVVHIHEPFVPGPSLGALLFSPAPVLVTFHRAGASSSYRLVGRIAQKALSRVDDFVAVSNAARKTAKEIFGPMKRPVAVIENAVDVARFEAARALEKDRPSVVFVGRHEQRKGLSVLLEAFEGLKEDVSLWVIGTGPLTPGLRARYEGDARIEFCGAIDDELLAERVAAADVLVAPSLYGESFGVVLLEAMAAGTAVIASDLPGYRLAAKDLAVFVKPGDARALGDALSFMLSDDALRAARVDAARTYAKTHSFSALAEEYLLRYDALADLSSR